ncbi:MAG: DUF4038 domain-containing protein [Bacteroidota bacterium]
MRITILLLLFSFTVHAQHISFPLKASSNRHYIVDQQNNPFFLKGCASWRLGYNVSYADVKSFLEERKKKGFNSLIVEITPDNGSNNGGNVPDLYGEYCFIDKDISRPNEKFFSHVDSVLQLCSEQNFVVLLFPLYLGCCRDGWLEILQAQPNSVQKCNDYGKWIANRYKHFKNIIWASGGDHNETPESIAFAEGIAEIDTSHLHTYHGNPAFTSVERLPNAKWLTLSCIFTYFPDMNIEEYHVYGQIYHEKLRNSRMPFIMAESAYEYERNENTQILRRQAYWSLLSGACGHFFGNRDLWVMNENWHNALNTPGNKSMEIFHSFLEKIPWYYLEPDWQHLVFISGRGTFNGGTDPGGEDYATGALTTDRSLGVIYLPTWRKISVNMERFGSPVIAKWFDPSSGKYLEANKVLQNKGIQFFSPPAIKNSQGFDDWVLVIETINKKTQ